MGKTPPTIIFDGKKVEPKDGTYRCPFKCGNPNYPQPKWKTEKGFRGHMKKCQMRPSHIKEKKEKERRILAETKEVFVRAIKSFPIKEGDTIHVSSYYVTKPTHKFRGNRTVRVRYEEERKYFSKTIKVESITSAGYKNHNRQVPTEEYVTQNCILINGSFYLGDVYGSIEDAERIALKSQKEYNEHVRFSQICR